MGATAAGGGSRKPDPAAGMPLTEHLRELRSRLLKSAAAIAVGMIAAWLAYSQVFAIIRRPFDEVVAQATASGREVTLAFTGVADPFVTQMKVAGVVGVMVACPVWLYQLWRFVTPGLLRNERRWALGFAGVATPLFLSGVALAYTFLPKGLDVLLGFTPANVENIISVDRYFSFFLRMLLVFGLGFLLPILVIGLNLAGVLPARTLLSWWRWIVMGVVVFAAVATPTGDPFNLSLLAVPMLALFLLAFVVCWVSDRRRAKRASAQPQWGDDEASDLDLPPRDHDSSSDYESTV
jgi:sec-independent protein translocase protein TatC